MKKIGFLAEWDFFNKHFGVRNLFMTILSVCSDVYDTDIIVHQKTNEGILWYICNMAELPMGAEKPQKCISFDVERNANFLKYTDFQRFMDNEDVGGIVPRAFYRCIGRDLAVENYDLLIFSNPWLIDFDGPLPAKKVVGIVHDIFANQFSLTKPTFDFSWAFAHNRGYLYYNTYCDALLGNSEQTAKIYNEYYHTNLCKAMPIFPPYAFKDAVYSGESKENALLLAAPFDPRKGIEMMPKIINSAADLIDTLYIYGMPRCPENMFDVFFKALRVRHIRYYPYLGNQELISLYKKCKVLLFPSLDEGQGTPNIEAQICGCRVVTTDKEPMRSLAGPGCYLLDETSPEKNRESLRAMMQCDDFDYENMSRNAKRRFSHSQILDMIRELISQ